jgi:phage baseplate assembly protein W
MSYVSFPFRIDHRGRTAEADHDRHVRDLIEQVLFTAMGERVNRPDFGTGVMQLVFAPGSDQLATTLQFMVRAALQQWLGDRLTINEVSVESQDAMLRVSVTYLVNLTQESRATEFTRST